MNSTESSRRRRALCVTQDLALRRILRRALGAAGTHIEFSDGPMTTAVGVDLTILDRACRARDATSIGEVGGPLIVVGDSLDDDDIIKLLRTRSLNHVISTPGESSAHEVLVTSAKIFSGDIFGLDKYLAWGGAIADKEIHNYDEKRSALQEIADYARGIGVRRQLVAKIESVTDELLMNALYDAPALRHGQRRAVGEPPSPDEVVRLCYASDERYFAVSVQDNFGELHKEAILDHLTRARSERGRPRSTESPTGGAGLGLYFIFAATTRFIANVEPGARTEVICLFDLQQRPGSQRVGAQSFHIFLI